MTEYSSYSSTVSDETPAAGTTAKMLSNQIKCFILEPEIILQARVNLASPVYPIGEIPFDNVTVGTYDYALAGMTFFLGSTPGANDLGRGRLRLNAATNTLYIGRSSRGVREGEVTATDNAYITVFNLFGVHSKQYYINSSGVTYKDGYIVYTDQNDESNPVANTGSPFAGTIDATTGLLECTLTGSGSFATADGATITAYLWDVGDEQIDSGTINDDTLVISVQPGFHWISLTVTDSNGKTHTARTFIYAHDSDFRDDIENFQITQHKITQFGQDLSVRIYDDLPLSTYIEGTIILFWTGQPEDSTDHNNVLYWGYTYGEPITQDAKKTGNIIYTTLECRDVAGMLQVLPGRSLILENEANRDTDKNPTSTWEYMTTPNLDKYIHYILHWHSTALEVTDFFWSNTGATYKFPVLGSEAQNLWTQTQQRVNAFVPDKLLTCDRLSRLRMLSDPMLQETADRTATEQTTITLDDWSNVSYTRITKPQIHWLHGDAIRAHATNYESYFSVAPGDAPGQGEIAQVHSEQLSPSQTLLNQVTGHRYARINAPQSKFNVTILDPDTQRIEPADLTWVRLIVGAGNRTPDSTFDTRGLVHEVNINYEYTRTGLVKDVSLIWEREVTGTPAITYIPPTTEPIEDTPVNPDIPDWEEGVIEPVFYDLPQAYLMWDGAVVLRTFNIMDTSPTWENVSTGLPASGLMDVRYSNTSTTVIGWALNILGVYVCMDLLAASPTWELILDIATILADDVAPSSGVNEFKCICTYASEPGYLMVVTGPDDYSDAANLNYLHSYFRHTHDYGATWTTVDANATLRRTVVGNTHAYCGGSLHGIEMMREEPTIICARSSILYSANLSIKPCISTDGGHTWSLGVEVNESTHDGQNAASVLHPYPAFNRWSYIVTGSIGARIKRSDDLWASSETIYDGGVVEPATLLDYNRTTAVWRVNKQPLDNNHLVTWFKRDDNSTWDLLETYDGGLTWTLLYSSGLSDGSTANLPDNPDPDISRFNNPNGWPVDNDIWWIIRNQVTSGNPANTIKMTVDNWSNTLDKVGNLASVLPAGLWTNGPAGGFALPKVGVNA